jgi:hypothetical protein
MTDKKNKECLDKILEECKKSGAFLWQPGINQTLFGVPYKIVEDMEDAGQPIVFGDFSSAYTMPIGKDITALIKELGRIVSFIGMKLEVELRDDKTFTITSVPVEETEDAN